MSPLYGYLHPLLSKIHAWNGHVSSFALTKKVVAAFTKVLVGGWSSNAILKSFVGVFWRLKVSAHLSSIGGGFGSMITGG